MPQWVDRSDNEDQRMPNNNNNDDDDDVRMPDYEEDVGKHRKVCYLLNQVLLLSSTTR